jgi:hypothetical protein
MFGEGSWGGVVWFSGSLIVGAAGLHRFLCRKGASWCTVYTTRFGFQNVIFQRTLIQRVSGYDAPASVSCPSRNHWATIRCREDLVLEAREKKAPLQEIGVRRFAPVTHNVGGEERKRSGSGHCTSPDLRQSVCWLKHARTATCGCPRSNRARKGWRIRIKNFLQPAGIRKQRYQAGQFTTSLRPLKTMSDAR